MVQAYAPRSSHHCACNGSTSIPRLRITVDQCCIRGSASYQLPALFEVTVVRPHNASASPAVRGHSFCSMFVGLMVSPQAKVSDPSTCSYHLDASSLSPLTSQLFCTSLM
jgi:hypothetical protein